MTSKGKEHFSRTKRKSHGLSLFSKGNYQTGGSIGAVVCVHPGSYTRLNWVKECGAHGLVGKLRQRSRRRWSVSDSGEQRMGDSRDRPREKQEGLAREETWRRGNCWGGEQREL